MHHSAAQCSNIQQLGAEFNLKLRNCQLILSINCSVFFKGDIKALKIGKSRWDLVNTATRGSLWFTEAKQAITSLIEASCSGSRRFFLD
jgi:hypothetical protein